MQHSRKQTRLAPGVQLLYRCGTTIRIVQTPLRLYRFSSRFGKSVLAPPATGFCFVLLLRSVSVRGGCVSSRTAVGMLCRAARLHLSAESLLHVLHSWRPRASV